MTATQRFKSDWPFFLVLIVLLWICASANGAPFGDLNRTNEVALTSDLTTVSNAFVTADSAKLDVTNGAWAGILSSEVGVNKTALWAGSLYTRSNDGGDINQVIIDDESIQTWTKYDWAVLDASGLTFGGRDTVLYNSNLRKFFADRIDLGGATITNWSDVGYVAADAVVSNAIWSKVGNLESGDDAFEGLQLDSTITEWIDLDTVLTNFIRQNTPIIVTNDSSWTGWTTTGDLVGTNIFMEFGEYLLSPVQTNGLADFTVTSASDGSATSSTEMALTNGVQISYPYYGTNGQVKITAGGTLLGATPGLTVSKVVIDGYGDLAEAAEVNYVSGLCRIEAETDPCDLTRKVYVDRAEADAKDYSDDQLDDYAADNEKTVRGAELRLGNMWVISPADTSGNRFIVSGGEISGDGELVGTTNEFILAKNDYPLMSFTSDASGLFITNFTVSATSSNVTMELFVATNGVTATPYAEWTDDLVVGEWSRVLTYATNTYPTVSNDTYELEFTVDATNTAYFRAMQAEGDSVATVHADIFDLEDSELWMTDSTGGVWSVVISTNGVLTSTKEE